MNSIHSPQRLWQAWQSARLGRAAARQEVARLQEELKATTTRWVQHAEKAAANHHETQARLSIAERDLGRVSETARFEYQRYSEAAHLAADRQKAIERLTEERDAARRQALELNARLYELTERAS